MSSATEGPLRAAALIAVALALQAQGACEPPPVPDAGPAPLCFIGDPALPAELELVWRNVAGEVLLLEDGQEVPLILPVQGGKVVYLGVRAKNVSCNLLLFGSLRDECQDPGRIIGSEGRPVELEVGADGWGVPINATTDIVVTNMSNIPVCPTFASNRDGDDQPYRLEIRATEALREGEDAPRAHRLDAVVVPVCGQAEIVDECRCECDADRDLDLTAEEQCPTINDGDLPRGECPAPP